MQTALRCLFMRGGTSRGPFFLQDVTRAALDRTVRLLRAGSASAFAKAMADKSRNPACGLRGEVMVPSAVFEQVCV